MKATWPMVLLLGLLVAMIFAGQRAFDILAEPARASAFAKSEAKRQGIEWPVHESISYGHGVHRFLFRNPVNHDQLADITVARTDDGFKVQSFDKEKRSWDAEVLHWSNSLSQ